MQNEDERIKQKNREREKNIISLKTYMVINYAQKNVVS